MIDTKKIQNSHLLTDVFGRFPSFHDSEVHRIDLIRGEPRAGDPKVKALIHVFQITSEVDDNNYYVLKNHVLVEFLFTTVRDLELVGFNYQNVLQSLEITEAPEGIVENPQFEVLFQGIFGVSAKFTCEGISIESVEPCENKT